MSSGREANGARKILLVGVGGQGVLSAASWLGEAIHATGQAVCAGQAHTMSRRGGSVSAAVVIGDHPVAAVGNDEADAVLAFEVLEASRAAPMLRAGGVVIVDPQRIAPFTLAQQGREYPGVDELLAALADKAGRLLVVPGTDLARAAGEARSANVVLLGALDALGVLPLPAGALLDSILATVPEPAQPVVRRAFAAGQEASAGGRSGTDALARPPAEAHRLPGGGRA